MKSLQQLKEQVHKEIVPKYRNVNDCMDSVIDQTILLIEQMVPEECPEDYSNDVGFNECRTEFLKRLHTFRGGEITK